MNRNRNCNRFSGNNSVNYYISNWNRNRNRSGTVETHHNTGLGSVVFIGALPSVCHPHSDGENHCDQGKKMRHRLRPFFNGRRGPKERKGQLERGIKGGSKRTLRILLECILVNFYFAGKGNVCARSLGTDCNYYTVRHSPLARSRRTGSVAYCRLRTTGSGR